MIGPELTAGIAKLNQRHNTTLFMFMHAALAVLLSRCSGKQDIAIGAAFSVRTHRDLEGLVGFFVNDLVLRIRVDRARGFTELLKQHRDTVLDAYTYQHIPFEMLVEELNPPRSMSYNPLFQIRLDVEYSDEPALPSSDDALPSDGITEVPPERVRVQYDLQISVREREKRLSLLWRYNPELFQPETIVRLCRLFRTLLESIIDSPEKPVHSLQILGRGEEQRLVAYGVPEKATTQVTQDDAAPAHDRESLIKRCQGALVGQMPAVPPEPPT